MIIELIALPLLNFSRLALASFALIMLTFFYKNRLTKFTQMFCTKQFPFPGQVAPYIMIILLASRTMSIRRPNEPLCLGPFNDFKIYL